jgi:MFS family permease
LEIWPGVQDFLTRSLEFVFTHCWAWGEALIEQPMNGHKNRSDPTAEPPTTRASEPPRPAVLGILLAISLSHLLNDTIQALLPAIYPLLKQSYHLDFGQIGLITLTFQMTASILQPVVGFLTDRRPLPFSLAYGMGFTLVGLVILSRAGSFAMILIAAGVIGLGSSVFHPEASRVARLASGGRHGFAQSLFQVGGNAGTSLGPLLAAAIVVPFRYFPFRVRAGVTLSRSRAVAEMSTSVRVSGRAMRWGNRCARVRGVRP